MRVLASNNCKSLVHYLAGKYEKHGLLGHLMSPDGWRPPVPWLPYALDNGAYTAFANDEAWRPDDFKRLLDRAAASSKPPLWVVVPDVVADKAGTLTRWHEWLPIVASYGFPPAFAVQDGMTKADVPIGAAVVFVGGSTKWKRATMPMWCREFPRVHVARINTERWLWRAHGYGAESCDGTGWFRGDPAQLRGLLNYLGRCAGQQGVPPEFLIPDLFEGEVAA